MGITLRLWLLVEELVDVVDGAYQTSYKTYGAPRLSGPRGSVHSGHGPARHFPARRDRLSRAGHHQIYPDDAPARGGGPERRLEPLADPGPSPTKVKTGLILNASWCTPGCTLDYRPPAVQR